MGREVPRPCVRLDSGGGAHGKDLVANGQTLRVRSSTCAELAIRPKILVNECDRVASVEVDPYLAERASGVSGGWPPRMILAPERGGQLAVLQAFRELTIIERSPYHFGADPLDLIGPD